MIDAPMASDNTHTLDLSGFGTVRYRGLTEEDWLRIDGSRGFGSALEGILELALIAPKATPRVAERVIESPDWGVFFEAVLDHSYMADDVAAMYRRNDVAALGQLLEQGAV